MKQKKPIHYCCLIVKNIFPLYYLQIQLDFTFKIVGDFFLCFLLLFLQGEKNPKDSQVFTCTLFFCQHETIGFTGERRVLIVQKWCAF